MFFVVSSEVPSQTKKKLHLKAFPDSRIEQLQAIVRQLCCSLFFIVPTPTPARANYFDPTE